MNYANLRKIIVRYETNPNNCDYAHKNDTEYLVDKSDVDNMVTALIKLHIEPDINPHNGGIANKIKLILLMEPRIGNFWWSSSDLIGTDKSKSATIIEMDSNLKILFASKRIMFKRNYQTYLECADGSGEYQFALASEGFSKEEIDQKYEKMIKKERRNIKKQTKAYLDPKYKSLIKNIDLDYKY